jgi:DnaJ-class molecular chaperone
MISGGGDTDIETLRKLAGLKDAKRMTAEDQLGRLLGKVWRNPYDVLQLDMGATDEEIKKKYKMVSFRESSSQ